MLNQDNSINKGVVILIFLALGITVACAVAMRATVNVLHLYPTPIGLGQNPSPITDLGFLPLPDAVITSGPAVTPDWENDRYTIFTRGLNSRVEIYSNRFGVQWLSSENFTLILRIADGQSASRAELRQNGGIESQRWSYVMGFPWPPEPFNDPLVQTIDGTRRIDSSSSLAPDARGPAVAEFVEWSSGLYGNDRVPLARCRHHVHGQITLTSVSPVVGNFQFACQFDATEYALVSGWFWE